MRLPWSSSWCSVPSDRCLLLASSCAIGLTYLTELFFAFYSGSGFERAIALDRIGGSFAWAFWPMVACNVVLPQLLWRSSLRRNLAVVLSVSVLVNVGMWTERLLIVVIPLQRGFLPSSWTDYLPTSIEVATTIGGFGLFLTGFLLFARFVPAVAMAEVKAVIAAQPPRQSP